MSLVIPRYYQTFNIVEVLTLNNLKITNRKGKIGSKNGGLGIRDSKFRKNMTSAIESES